ncbi:MAG: hypothetical protein R3C58_09365 [Parvularculaceae bacterium]
MATRRQVLTAAGAIGLIAPNAFATGAPSSGLFLYDRRDAASRRLASAAASSGVRLMDVSGEHHKFWRGVRAAANNAGETSGVTRWSDWVAIRGEFEASGKRVIAEERLNLRSGPATLFFWRMR